jgi:hypothetical protein
MMLNKPRRAVSEFFSQDHLLDSLLISRPDPGWG